VPKNYWKGSAEKIMREKLRNKKGFTLAELLIVVAIIAILVAIMIPVFGTTRAKAILARDAANIRSIYSELVVNAMTDGSATYTGGKIDIDLGSALTNSGLKFDAKTSAKYTLKTTTSQAKITVTYPGITDTEEVILIDDDVHLMGYTSGTGVFVLPN